MHLRIFCVIWEVDKAFTRPQTVFCLASDLLVSLLSTVLLAPSYKTIFQTYVKCSLHPSHSDFLLEHFFVSVFNMDFPSMIRLNNIIIVAGFVVFGNCRACGECLICLTLLMTLSQKSDVPLDWQRSQFHLYCQTRTGTKLEASQQAPDRINKCNAPRPAITPCCVDVIKETFATE